MRVSVYQGLVVSGKRLMIYGQIDPNIHREGMQPLIGVDEFRFRGGVLSLLPYVRDRLQKILDDRPA